jgi:hypothetical protein
MSEDNGQLATADAEEAVAEAAAADERPWLDADALTPRDYVRGKTALAAVLAEHKMGSCYELLAGETMYPWCIWALKSRDDPDYTWEQALDEPFWQFRIGDDHRPPPRPAPPRSSPGSAGITSGEPSATRRPPRRAPGRSSGSSTT